METSIDKKRAVTLALIACAVLAGPALAQGASDTQTFINAKDIKWTDAPPSMHMTYINPDDDPQKAKK